MLNTTRLFVSCAALCLAAMASTGVKAGELTGEQLHKYCHDVVLDNHGKNGIPFDIGLCDGFVRGVLDVAAYTANKDMKICLPDGVTNGTITEIVANFVEDTPESRQYPAFAVVIHALKDKYPCN